MPKKTKSKKATVKKVSRKQCSTKGCRKLRAGKSLHCQAHDKQAADDPISAVKRLTEMDRLRFVETDTQLRNLAQEMKILNQEHALAKIEYDARISARRNRLAQIQVELSARLMEQKQLLGVLADRYEFDATQASIDDRTGVVHEHS